MILGYRFMFIVGTGLIWLLGLSRQPAMAQAPALPNPILFVTQLPVPSEWMTISQTFGNHLAGVRNCGRGGDLWIRYPDGTLKNLTEIAGYGNSGFQGAQSIAVRDPHVHWSGEKAIFSMVLGATEQRYVHETYYWQLYEITGLGQNDTPVISRVANQPPDYNNISPIYGSDDRIIFTSDRPRNGARHLYPQRDEYESAYTVTGLWSLDPATGDLFIMNHAPSGAFRPYLDSFGRVLFTRWDHLQRDQQNDAGTHGAFNWSSEDENSTAITSNEELFPESRYDAGNINGHTFELFFPWQINEDGTQEEVLNHLGRHELSNYFEHSFLNDPALGAFLSEGYNPNRITNFFQIKEDPAKPGDYFGIDSPTFYHHSGGRIIKLSAAPQMNPDSIMIHYLTNGEFVGGHFRHPLPLHNGDLIASHTDYNGLVANLGTRENPRSPFRFRLKLLQPNGNTYSAGQFLTGGIKKAVNFWDPDVMVTYADSINMWELDPVEVVSRNRPQPPVTKIAAPEMQILSEENIDIAELENFLREQNLALVISRNVTTRDAADRQQPFNLRVAGSGTETRGSNDALYDIAHMQFFQGDQIRGYGNPPEPGRRVLAQPMHDDNHQNLPNPEGPAGSVRIASDGSMAAFVPARRAMTWQSTDGAGNPIVRERYWLTFQPGEIRTCPSCHGANTKIQNGGPVPQNPPEALRELMQHYQTIVGIAPGESTTAPETPWLAGNYPNPFNPATTIRYIIPKQAVVTLKIFNLLGQEIETLVNGRQPAGEYAVQWDAENFSSGVYIYQFSAGEYVDSRKMVLMR